MWSLVKNWCNSTRWQHGVALVLSIVGLGTYPYVLLDFTNSPLTYMCVLALVYYIRPHVRGSLQKFQITPSVHQLGSKSVGGVQGYIPTTLPHITLLHSGSGILNPVLYNPGAFVPISSRSIFLLSQWLYYLNPLLIIFLEMLSGVEISYLRDFNVRTLLAQKRHLLITPGGPLENVSSSDQCQAIVLTKYPYWYSVLQDHKTVHMDCTLVYGGLRLLWKQPTFLTQFRTWMARRDLPTCTILYPRFQPICRVLYTRTLDLTPCTLLDMYNKIRDSTATDSAGTLVNIPLCITSRPMIKKLKDGD